MIITIIFSSDYVNIQEVDSETELSDSKFTYIYIGIDNYM